jgi:DNA polymerase III delta prime subunit
MHANIIDGGTRAIRQELIAGKITGLVNAVHISAEKSSITIKQIQEMVASLVAHSPLPRIIWIEEANQMTPPAQNALLKSLEEPPQNTTFYLTVDNASMLLPTIRSRSQVTHLERLNQMPSHISH